LRQVPQHRPADDLRDPRSLRWIDASAANRSKTAETVAAKSYVNTDVDVIRSRMIGQYENGLGKSWSDKNYMKFYNDGR
jgi:nitrate/nitrite transport system substrate-binding protein